MDLEANEGLDVNNPAHIWLLHFLFLGHINSDAVAWAEAWNNHKLQIRREHQQSPHEMFFFSMYEDGPRGLNGPRQHREVDRLEEEDIESYGVDWEDMDDEELMAHHHQHNPLRLDNPLNIGPPVLSEVECTPPDCPLSAESTLQLYWRLSRAVDVNSRSMLIRRMMWIEALHIFNEVAAL